jgi:methylated-DNA-[protein]-cysteine S-methyltransferase
MTLHYDTFASPLGKLHIFWERTKGLYALNLSRELPGKPAGPVLSGVYRELNHQLTAYFRGARQSFTIPLAPPGTPFQKKVWQALGRIAYGTTCSYGELATAIGRPAAARAVGNALGANPILICQPCHRVIAGNGTLGGFSCGLEKKRLLLKLEGITLM